LGRGSLDGPEVADIISGLVDVGLVVGGIPNDVVVEELILPLDTALVSMLLETTVVETDAGNVGVNGRVIVLSMLKEPLLGTATETTAEFVVEGFEDSVGTVTDVKKVGDTVDFISDGEDTLTKIELDNVGETGSDEDSDAEEIGVDERATLLDTRVDDGGKTASEEYSKIGVEMDIGGADGIRSDKDDEPGKAAVSDEEATLLETTVGVKVEVILMRIAKSITVLGMTDMVKTTS
jgi:hypothetical protein